MVGGSHFLTLIAKKRLDKRRLRLALKPHKYTWLGLGGMFE